MRLLIFGILLACDTDKGVTVHNPSPVAHITTHNDGDDIPEGSVEIFKAALTDNNHSTDELVAAWYVDGEEICEHTAPNEMGDSDCEISIGAEAMEVKVEVRDPKNAVGSQQITINPIPNQAPVAEISTPATSDTHYSNVQIEFFGSVYDEEDNDSELSVMWTSDLEGELPLEAVVDSNGLTYSTGYLIEGTHLITLTVTDTNGKTGSDEETIIVSGENNAPNCEITSPMDGSLALDGEDIMFMGSATDLESAAADISVSWISSIDGDFGSSVPSSDGSVIITSNSLSLGSHEISMRAVDEHGAECVHAINLTVDSCGPTSAENPYDGDDSNCDGLEAQGVECVGRLSTSAEGDVYYLYCDHLLYWDEANNFCKDNGYDGLASVRNAIENNAVVELIELVDDGLNPNLSHPAFHGSSFLGFSRYSEYAPSGPTWDYGYRWVDESPVNFVNWKTGEPNNSQSANGEGCVEFVYNNTYRGQWNDIWCALDEPPNPSWASQRHFTCSKRFQ